jgi:hypothetical protein
LFDLDGIRAAIEDSSVTYTEGFYPQDDKFDNSFHNLKVKLADFLHLDLRYRKGYVDQSTPPQDEVPFREALHDAVLSPMNANGIGLHASLRQTDVGFDVTTARGPQIDCARSARRPLVREAESIEAGPAITVEGPPIITIKWSRIGLSELRFRAGRRHRRLAISARLVLSKGPRLHAAHLFFEYR